MSEDKEKNLENSEDILQEIEDGILDFIGVDNINSLINRLKDVVYYKDDEDYKDDKEKNNLKDIIEEKKDACCKNKKVCKCNKNKFDESENINEKDFENEKRYKYSMKKLIYNDLYQPVYIIKYGGISDEFIKSDNFFEWVNSIYTETFQDIFTNNFSLIEKDCLEGADNVISEIRFEFYSKSNPKNNLAVTPWYWDNEMHSFYYIDNDGHSNYVRYIINNDNKVEVCIKNGSVVTDVISEEDRKSFINMMNNILNDKKECDDEKCDKMSKNDKIFDELSHSEDKNECGTHFDTNNTKNNEDRNKVRSFKDIINPYDDCKIYVSEKNQKSKKEYSPTIKKIYKDILYNNYCNKFKLNEKYIFELFNYMLSNNLFDYNETDSQIIISVSCEEMVANIDKLNYEINDNSSTELPFMNTILYYNSKMIDWKDFDMKNIVKQICEEYNFDEVAFIGKQQSDDKIKYYILCSFESM